MTALKAYYRPPVCIVGDEGITRNVASSLQRKLPWVTRKPAKSGRLAIVASGPSASDHLDELSSWDGEIWAINGAFCWLVSQGITPDAFVFLDPEGGMPWLLPERPESATYYLSAMTAPDMLDHLRDRNVMLWCAWHKEVQYPEGASIIQGGTTCLTRAPFLAYELGWRDMTIFGGDSSFRDDELYCYDQESFERKVKPDVLFAKVGEQVFATCHQMMCQVSFLAALTETPRFASILKFRADGLLKAFLDAPIMPVTIKAA